MANKCKTYKTDKERLKHVDWHPFLFTTFESKPLNFINELCDNLLCSLTLGDNKGIYECPRHCRTHDCHDCDICPQVIMHLSIGLLVNADVLILFNPCSPHFLHPQEHVSIKAHCLRYVSIPFSCFRFLLFWALMFLYWDLGL